MPDGSQPPYQEICVKGYTNIERMYSDRRVLYPMRRVQGTERGAGEWERISWDEAIEQISSTWKDLIAAHGPESVAFLSCSGTSGTTPYYTGRLHALMGAMGIDTCQDETGLNCQNTHSGSGYRKNGGAGHNQHHDIQYSDNIFIWGTNPTESLAVDYHMITEAQQRGAKVVCIDPNFTTAAAKADLWVPIRPCTDGLLAVGMAQIAIRDGFEDKKHLQTMTVAPFLVKDSDALYLRLSDLGKAEAGSDEDKILVYENGQAVPFDEAGDPEIRGNFEVEGHAVKPAYQILMDRFYEWDLDTISAYTEIPVETIEELSAIYTSGLTMIFEGFGPDHYSNGQTMYDGIYALGDITGQECKHGAGFTLTDWSTARASGLGNTAYQGIGDATPGSTIYGVAIHELVEKGSLAEFPVAPKSVYVYVGNPLGNLTDRQAWLKTFNAMDLIVVADMFMSDTARYADIILPVAFLFERNDLSSSGMFVKMMEKTAEPMGESLSDFEIVTKLGRAMGYEEYFTQTEEEFLRSCVENETAQELGITWDRLKEEHAIYSCPEEPQVVGLNEDIKTDTGRMEFYHEGIQPQTADRLSKWDMAKESCWFWEPPLEAWHENPLAEKYPLIFISERDKFKTHTMFNYLPSLLELHPEPYVKVNPVDADARDIKEGDVVKLFNDRGFVVLKVVLNAGVRPGMIMIDHGWQQDSFIDGHYSDLTCKDSWPRVEQQNWFDCLCQMEKVQ